MIVKFPDPRLFVGNLKAALRAACVDLARAHMACVRVELRSGRARFVATNGHWLWINETTVEGVTEEAVIHFPIDEAKALAKAFNVSKKASTWAVELDTEARTATQLSTTIRYTAPETGFPPYLQIIPQAQKRSKAPAVALAAEYVTAVACAFAELCPTAALLFEPNAADALAPVVVTSEKVPDALVVLMPRRDAPKDTAALLERYRAESSRAA